MNMKHAVTLLIIAILVASALAIPAILESDDEEDKIISKEEFLGREITVAKKSELTNKFFIIDTTPKDEDFQSVMTNTACLTPLFVQSGKNNHSYNPLVVGSEEKGVETLEEITDREVVNLGSGDVNSKLYLEYYESCTAAFLVENYSQAILAAPSASLLGVPVFVKEDSTYRNTMKKLNVEFLILIGDTKAPGDIEKLRIQSREVNNVFMELLQNRGLESNYIVVTNPNDISDYADNMSEGKLPVSGLSILAAELAAYHRAPIFFSQGLPDFDKSYGDGFTQLGISRKLNNQVANKTKECVLNGNVLLESYDMSAEYLGLVGGPVTLPMYSWDINDYQQDRQYTPCDYYFGDLNDDPYQELAVGRIFARSLTDASLMLVRTLAFNEVKNYDYPTDTSSTVYDTVSEDWKENSLACVGTTKIGPGPGILTPTLANQTATMTEAGYHTTSMGYDLATQAEIVKEIIDEMNYAVYYGHGDYDCWYSTVPDPIDADMINGEDLKPGFAIAMACLTGMTDSVEIDLDQMISLAFIHSGYTGYIGATRVAYGLYDYEIRDDGAICGTGALYLVDVFSQRICEEDTNVGMAMKDAKNNLIFKDGWENEEVKITVTQYVLYGDPAHNLHVPIHDG